MTPDPADEVHLARAIVLAREHMRLGHGGPFGALVVLNGRPLAEGWNQVVPSRDPTAHAEITAIREAARALGDHRLTGCVLYSSCEPCPMCLGAAYWARIDRIVFAATRADAAEAGFDDALLYHELAAPPSRRRIPLRSMMREAALEVFAEWAAKADRVPY